MTVTEAISKGQKISVGTMVTLPFNQEGEIIGFVPAYRPTLSNYCVMDYLVLPRTGSEAKIFGDRIVFQHLNGVREKPIFKHVEMAKENKYDLVGLLLCRRQFDLDSTLKWNQNVEPCFKAYFNGENRHDGYDITNLYPHYERNDDEDKRYYIAQPDDIYFTGDTKLTAIGNIFSVIVRRYANDTYIYTVMDPTDVSISDK